MPHWDGGFEACNVFCFYAVAASASSSSSSVKQSPWLCILNMQQPHAARTIKHLEMAATTATATVTTKNAPIAGRAKELTSWQRQAGAGDRGESGGRK